jgi:hypothetical protein
MARENLFFIHGQVHTKPKIYLSDDGEPKKALIAVRILRRPFLTGNGQIAGGKLYLDSPMVVTTDKEMIEKISGLSMGDMVDVRGVLTLTKVKKKSMCSQGHENITFGDFVYITPIYICPRERGLSKEDGLTLLRERNEISNLAVVIGTLCRDPESYTFPDGRVSTQYQIAVNRRYHIHGSVDSERTDYPWVRSYGKQAAEDAMRLRTNSVVFINGAIQTREIQRTAICETCGEEYSWGEKVTELFPYATEYLMNCIFPEREKEEAEPEVEAVVEGEV